jgi:hypothetical protein
MKSLGNDNENIARGEMMRKELIVPLILLLLPISGCLNEPDSWYDDDISNEEHLSIDPSLEVNLTGINWIVDLNDDGILDTFTTRDVPSSYHLGYTQYLPAVKISSGAHFEGQTVYPLSNRSLEYGLPQPAFSDLNNDGLEDIIMIYPNVYSIRLSKYPIEIYLQDNGFSKEPDQVLWLGHIYDLKIADFDRDGLMDIFCSHSEPFVYSTTFFQIFYQMNNTEFSESHSFSRSVEGGGYFYDIGLIDDDEFLDVLFFRDSYLSPGMVTIFRTFCYDNGSKDYTMKEYKLNEREHRFEYGYLFDVNSDGELDIITAYDSDTDPPGLNPALMQHDQWYSNANMIFYQENGVFNTTPGYFDETPNSLSYLEMADFNDDGLPDLISIGRRSMFLLFQDRSGEFVDPIRFNYPDYFVDIHFLDYNGDSTKDIVLTSSNSDGYGIVVYLMDEDLDNNGYSDTFDEYYRELEIIQNEEDPE